MLFRCSVFSFSNNCFLAAFRTEENKRVTWGGKFVIIELIEEPPSFVGKTAEWVEKALSS